MAWFDKKPWPYSVHSVWLSCVVLIKHDSSLALLPAGALFTASAGRWMRLHALWPTCVLVIMWHQSSVLSTGFRSVSAYNTNCVFWCMVLLTGMRPTTSAIWPHWHQLRRLGHIFALPTASPLISFGRGQGWAIGHCQSLVHVTTCVERTSG